nr:uncharacterized protein LOC115268709 isoform X1 [Aedes albopictus]XP_029732674.1 uncharacterized protein LOC115268709 isoform X1 [Aedes albopictus]
MCAGRRKSAIEGRLLPTVTGTRIHVPWGQIVNQREARCNGHSSRSLPPIDKTKSGRNLEPDLYQNTRYPHPEVTDDIEQVLVHSSRLICASTRLRRRRDRPNRSLLLLIHNSLW